MRTCVKSIQLNLLNMQPMPRSDHLVWVLFSDTSFPFVFSTVIWISNNVVIDYLTTHCQYLGWCVSDELERIWKEAALGKYTKKNAVRDLRLSRLCLRRIYFLGQKERRIVWWKWTEEHGLDAGFLIGLLINPEDGIEIFLRIINCFLSDYTALYPII